MSKQLVPADPKFREAIDRHYIGHAPAQGGRVEPIRECEGWDCIDAVAEYPLLKIMEEGTAPPYFPEPSEGEQP